MAAQTLTIEFPENAVIPRDVSWDPDLLRYGVAGALYVKGLLSLEEAQRLTGDVGRIFEKKLRELGFRIRGNEESEPASTDSGGSQWTRVAEYFVSEKAGHLNGRSEEALEHLKDFRKQFEL